MVNIIKEELLIEESLRKKLELICEKVWWYFFLSIFIIKPSLYEHFSAS